MSRSIEQVQLHPAATQRQQFIAGELSPGLSVALSAHIEYCSTCQRASSELETQLSEDWQDVPVAADMDSLSAILDNIVQQPQVKVSEPVTEGSKEITINQRNVARPRVLAKIAAEGLPWKRLTGGISQATVNIDESTKCEFIYMAPGSKTPVHTHRGNEVTLVLDGSFSDEAGEYKTADFVMRDPSHQHQPRTENGCLCFSLLDSPLVLTSGLWPLLNPLNRLMFQKSQWFR